MDDFFWRFMAIDSEFYEFYFGKNDFLLKSLFDGVWSGNLALVHRD